MKQFTRQIKVSPDTLGELTAYLLDSISTDPDKKRMAVIICPGGGYNHVSDREGEPIAAQFLSMGYHAFVLRYSLAPHVFPASLKELASAMAMVRANADEWKVDPNRILVCGFSAGGHLAASLGIYWDSDFLASSLSLSKEMIKPDGMILGYPVITSGPFCHPGSFEKLLGDKAEDKEARQFVSIETHVTSSFPKPFLWHTAADQSVPVENSLLLAQALIQNQVNLEMHIYPVGCHGLSLATSEVSSPDGRCVEPQCQSWVSLVKTWLENF